MSTRRDPRESGMQGRAVCSRGLLRLPLRITRARRRHAPKKTTQGPRGTLRAEGASYSSIALRHTSTVAPRTLEIPDLEE